MKKAFSMKLSGKILHKKLRIVQKKLFKKIKKSLIYYNFTVAKKNSFKICF